MPKVSVIIRTLNEKEHLQELLAALRAQDFQDFEVVVVDNESTDGTAELAEKSGCKVVTIKRERFSFPKSMNFGALYATGDILIFTVGHALPVRKDWISCAVEHLADSKVAGVYSPVIPNKGCSLVENLYYYPGYLLAQYRGPHKAAHTGMGIFGGTNIAIPRALWLEHGFDHRFGAGGDDGEWAAWALGLGYDLICDHRFAVRHSHNLGISGLYKQLKYWSRLGEPHEFHRGDLAFREDLKF